MAQSTTHRIIDDYKVQKLIGVGTSSNVFLARHRVTFKRVAIKVIKRLRLTKAEEEAVMSEIKFMETFNHKYIVKMFDSMVDTRYIYIIQEYCNGGNLLEYIHKHGRLSEQTCKQLLQQLATALKYMRSFNISHLDLKPDNIFLIKSETITIKLGDFGLSKVMTENTKNGYFCGSFIYMAPEMIIVKEFDIKADLWSIGVILYECLFEHTPYSISHTASIKKLFANIRKQNPIEIPSDIISPKCRDLLLGLLQHDPINRMNHKQFYIHPFIDLDHSASEESLSKGVKAAAMATHLQWESRFAESYISYIIALEYIIPYYKAEAEGTLKRVLKTQIESYIERIHQLKQLYLKPQVKMVTGPKDNFQTLKSMCKKIPLLDFAINTGISAKLYAFEGEIESAMERLKICLKSLQSLDQQPLDNEYNNIIKQQITEWTEEYEVVQTLLQTTDQQLEKPRINPLNNLIFFIPDFNVSTDDEQSNYESTDEFTNDQTTEAQAANYQPAEAQAANSSEEPTVVTVRRIKRIKKWFINFIRLFKRRHD